jgi:hypothetical protein
MPRFLTPIYVREEIVTGNETISGNETILGVTSGRDAYWNNTVIHGGLTASTANFNTIYGNYIDWMTLVRGYKTTPSLSASLSGGDVYTYTFSTTGTDLSYYRYIANDGSEDKFYSYFAGNTLSGLIASKAIIL